MGIDLLATRSIDPEAWFRAGSLFRFEDLQIFHRRAGSGPAMVCLHGFPTSSWDFRDLWDDLVSCFDVLAHDLVGLGYSSKPDRPLPVALQADVVEALCRHHGLEQAHLFAHDLGDTVAQELLARQQEGSSTVRWLSCLFLNGGLFPETHRPRLIQRALASPLGPWIAHLTSERRFRKSLTAVFGPETPPSDDFLDGSWFLLTRDGGRRMLPHLIRYMDERRRFRDRWVTPLMEPSIPLRFVNGALDPVSGRHAADRYRELVPNADVVSLDPLGHYPHVEDPAAVLRPALDFFRTELD